MNLTDSIILNHSQYTKCMYNLVKMHLFLLIFKCSRLLGQLKGRLTHRNLLVDTFFTVKYDKSANASQVFQNWDTVQLRDLQTSWTHSELIWNVLVPKCERVHERDQSTWSLHSCSLNAYMLLSWFSLILLFSSQQVKLFEI